MPPTIPAIPAPPLLAPGGPPALIFTYQSPFGDGTWNIGPAGGVAIYRDAGVTKSDTLVFVERFSTTGVFGPQSGTLFHVDGWIYAASEIAIGPSGHWFFGANFFNPTVFSGAFFIVGFNQAPHGTPASAMQFQGWPSLCNRTP